jgi:hypothetical protein
MPGGARAQGWGGQPCSLCSASTPGHVHAILLNTHDFFLPYPCQPLWLSTCFLQSTSKRPDSKVGQLEDPGSILLLPFFMCFPMLALLFLAVHPGGMEIT